LISPPLVTALLLAYRHERFVAEALRSLLAQTYQPLEIIVVDDASPDATPRAIAAELALHPGRTDIRVIVNPRNLGFSGNTIRAIAEAKGSFIIRLAADDIFAPTLIERMVEVWLRENVSLITVNATYIDADSRPLHRFYSPPGAIIDESFDTLACDGVNTACFGAVIGFERALFDEFGWAPDSLEASDIIMPFYAYLAKGARFIADPLVQYRTHGGNASHSLAAERATNPVDRLLAEEHIHYVHLAHSLWMDDELIRFNDRDPDRFGPIAQRIRPLLAVQQTQWLIDWSKRALRCGSAGSSGSRRRNYKPDRNRSIDALTTSGCPASSSAAR